MNRRADTVKTSRRYDSSRRQAHARLTREAILDSAQRQFLDRGFSATTVASIATEAGVSTDTIFKSFGGKPGLVKAICRRGLEGAGPIPAEQRSDALQKTETDPRKITQGFGALTAEVAPRVAPLMLLLAAAAQADPEMATLRAELDANRLVRMTHNAAVLSERGLLRPDLTVEQAGQICWTYSSPELYRLLVLEQHWSVEEYGRFVGDALTDALLPRASSPATHGNRP
jgi:AcrR family transcriptional regulator